MAPVLSAIFCLLTYFKVEPMAASPHAGDVLIRECESAKGKSTWHISVLAYDRLNRKFLMRFYSPRQRRTEQWVGYVGSLMKDEEVEALLKNCPVRHRRKLHLMNLRTHVVEEHTGCEVPRRDPVADTIVLETIVRGLPMNYPARTVSKNKSCAITSYARGRWWR